MRLATMIGRNLARRRARTALTLLGLGVGIAAVLALLGIAWGFEKSFVALYQAKGIDLMVVRAGVTDRLTSSLDESLAPKLRAIPGVRELSWSLIDAVSFEDANLVGVLVNGWEPDSLLFRGIRVTQGRRWNPGEKGAALIGRVLALNLGKRVGDTIEVSGAPFRVVGIFESTSPYENGALILPIDVLQKMMGREGQVTGFTIGAERSADPGAIQTLARRIEATIPRTAAVPARDYIQQDIQIRLVQAMAWATSVVALVLGSLGMLNTMIMAVFERTREIGVLRALGWKRRRVMTLILGEAMIVGLLGAILGTGLSFVGVRLIALAPSARGFISGEVSPGVIPVGLMLGFGLSILGGLYPGLRASRLDPIEALRHE